MLLAQKEPDEYLLVRFGDPDVGSPFVTSNANEFLGAVNALSAGGGGDCPELSQSALLTAVGASRSDSTLFLFTDADAKDASLGTAVNAAAQEKRTKITPVLNGACGSAGFVAAQQRVDSVYKRNAEETGRQLFVLRSSEVNRTFDLVRPQLTGNFVSILSANGTMGGTTSTFDVPIDSTVRDATFSVSIDTVNTISLLRPSGTVVTASDPGVKMTDLSSGRIITVNTPESGLWKLQVAGQGAFSVAAKATSSLQFASFNFVTLEGESIGSETRHEGFFPIEGQPVVGSNQTGLADLTGQFSTANFTLLAQNGQPLQQMSLMQNNPDASADEFVGTFGLPSEPFRVSVSGIDGNGVLYQRLFPALFRAQSIIVSVDTHSSAGSLAVGQATTIKFVVHNLGAAQTFTVIAGNNKNFATQSTPKTLTLASNATATVDVVITVPRNTAIGTEVVLTTAVVSSSDPAVNNSASVNLLTTAKIFLPVIIRSP